MDERTTSTSSRAAPDPLAVANRLRPVLLHLGRHLRRETDALGVTGSQASVLGGISARPGVGVGELAAREGMSSPTMCAHLDRLEAAGLVTRARADSSDRRRVGLSVTDRGAETLRALRSRRTAWLAARLRELSADELEQVAAAIEPLARLVEEPATTRRAEEPHVPTAGATG